MKLLLITMALFASISGWKEKTGTVKIKGNCEMCKARIERSLQTAGVNKSDWNVETKILTVTYDDGITNMDKIQQAVANSGHDTEKYRTPDAIYSKLPGCCRYEREKSTAAN
ncbi:MAG TPA: heavy-metal-associated domain-containing protein [Sphingobacteriaceae bacterium]|nr:heavy-metal-associated domain-containing protein [Sphingobacteriaceae bacterium]